MATVCSTSGCGTGGWTGPLPGDPDNSSVLTASSEYGGIQLLWTLPNVNAFAVAHTKVFRNTVDNIETAPLLVVISGNQFFDRNSADTIQEYFYWIQHVSINGTTLFPIGPITATPRAQIEQVIAALTNRIEDSALSTALRESIEQIPVLENGLTLTNQTLVTETGLTAQELVALRDDLTDAVAYIDTQTQLQLDQQGTFVSSLNTQLAQFGDTLYAAVEEETETRALETGELFAQKTVRFDLAGNISGYGMSASVDPDGNSVSDFQIRADTFSMAPPVVNQATPPDSPFHGMIWGDTSETPMVVKWYDDVLQAWGTTPIQGTVPFIVKATPEVVDGYTVPAGVYIDSAIISRLQARQVDTRGLTVKNELGEVLLDASGETVPPWLVNVTTLTEPGAISFGMPRDESNRSAIRGLMVDGANLKVRYSPSEKSVVLSSASREVWHLMYAGEVDVYLADSLVTLWGAYYELEANTAYILDMRLLAARAAAVPGDPAGTSNLEFRLWLPENTTGQVFGGASFNTGTSAQDISIFTLAGGNALPGWADAPNKKVFIKTGETRGVMQVKAIASTHNMRLGVGTLFALERYLGYTTPGPTAVRVGQVPTPFSQPANVTPNTGVVWVVTPTPTEAYQVDVLRQRGGNGDITTFMTASILNNISETGEVRVGLSLRDRVGTSFVTNVFVHTIVTDVPPSEASRWSFEFSVDVITPGVEFYLGNTSLGFAEYMVPTTPSLTVPVSPADQQRFIMFDTFFSDDTSMVRETQFLSVFLVKIQPKFMGLPVGDAWVSRWTLNYPL